MRITQVEAFPLSYRFEPGSMTLALGRVYKKDLVLVKVTTDEGLVGYGESHHALAPTAVAELVNTTLRELVVGEDPFNTEGLWAKIYRYQIKSHSMGTGVVIAMSGIDMALWDIKGKALGVPVYRLLGGERKPIRAYAGGLTLGFQEPEALAEEVARLIEEFGFTAVKLRIGDNVRDDLRRVRHVRKVFGDDLEIMVDANTRYDYVDMYQLLPGLEECQVTWLEEPFPRNEVTALAELRRRSRIGIATGENLHARHEFRTLIEARAADFLQPDASKTGGISELKKIGDMAATYHLRFAPHVSHSAINHAATMHVLSASQSAYIYEADATDNRFNKELFSGPVSVVRGMVQAPDAPGLGIEVNESRLKDFSGIPGPAYKW